MEITQQINKIKEELDSPEINKQRRRHLEDELNNLQRFNTENPAVVDCPTALELFCYFNPDSSECRIYEL